MHSNEPLYGQCSKCGGSLTIGHRCAPSAIFGEDVKARRLADAIRIYAAACGIQNKELAKAWDCSESTVSRFLGGQQYPDGPTMLRIVTWLVN